MRFGCLICRSAPGGGGVEVLLWCLVGALGGRVAGEVASGLFLLVECDLAGRCWLGDIPLSVGGCLAWYIRVFDEF